MNMKPIYLDYNATTPIDTQVIEAMRPFIEEYFGNPSSSHAYGQAARRAVENARLRVSRMLDCQPQEIVFTSGGSESNNMAIKGVALAAPGHRKEILISAVEHPAVVNVCRYLENYGICWRQIPVDKQGRIRLEELERMISAQTCLISVMHANNEVGTVQPIAEVAGIAHRHGIPVHCDAAQTVGKLPVSVRQLGVDLLSIAGHKFYAPKGIGALFIREGIRIPPLIHGAGQEGGRRAGTENVAFMVGMGQASELVSANLNVYSQHMKENTALLWRLLSGNLDGLRMNGEGAERLPNTLSVGFAGVTADRLIDEVPGVAVSAGAACHSGGVSISATLKAMDVPGEFARGTLRFSTGRKTTESEIRQASEQVIAAVKRLRAG